MGLFLENKSVNDCTTRNPREIRFQISHLNENEQPISKISLTIYRAFSGKQVGE